MKRDADDAEPDRDGGLRRTMGLLPITALGVGAMVGAGVFVLTGLAAGEAGPALVLVFALNGCIALVIGGCYAELATMMPRAGGAYIWARPALGDIMGFFTGWCSWFAQTVACAFYAISFGTFAAELVAEFGGGGLDPTIMAMTILALLVGANLIGTGSSGVSQVVLAGLQMGVIAVFIGFGLSELFGSAEPSEPFVPFLPEGPIGVLAAMGLTFIAFEGFEIIVQSSEEARAPSRMIPRAIGLSICIVVLVYVLTAVVLIGTVEAPEGASTHEHLASLGEMGVIEAGRTVMPFGKTILLVAALASTASALNATVFGASRVAVAMARTGDLPDLFKSVSERGAPVPALLLIAGIVAGFLLLLPIKDIAASTDIMFIIVFTLVAVSLQRLRGKRSDRDRPFRLPLVPWTTGFVIASGVALSLSLGHVSLAAWVVAAGWTALGLGYKFWLSKW